MVEVDLEVAGRHRWGWSGAAEVGEHHGDHGADEQGDEYDSIHAGVVDQVRVNEHGGTRELRVNGLIPRGGGGWIE